jgi:catechol 2,3-dioxygenase
MDPFSIHPDTNIATVFLTVADLQRSERFYRDVLGFKPLGRQDDTLLLSADGRLPLLSLRENPAAGPRPPRSTGLYHFAILVPERADLARSILHIIESNYPIQGGADHRVSEALYLADPDGNGIEIYRDRPREAWAFQGTQVRMATDPLDFDGILSEAASGAQPWSGLAPGTRVGHIHLNVANIPGAEAFYHGLLGFEIMAHLGNSALFVSAGGYHHHIGLNTWEGVGAPPAPPGTVGLRHFEISLPDVTEFAKLAERLQQAGVALDAEMEGVLLFRDPFENGIMLTYRAA